MNIPLHSTWMQSLSTYIPSLIVGCNSFALEEWEAMLRVTLRQSVALVAAGALANADAFVLKVSEGQLFGLHTSHDQVFVRGPVCLGLVLLCLGEVAPRMRDALATPA